MIPLLQNEEKHWLKISVKIILWGINIVFVFYGKAKEINI